LLKILIIIQWPERIIGNYLKNGTNFPCYVVK
jgi:hypothetical protein